jgi:hypothetical protein
LNLFTLLPPPFPLKLLPTPRPEILVPLSLTRDAAITDYLLFIALTSQLSYHRFKTLMGVYANFRNLLKLIFSSYLAENLASWQQSRRGKSVALWAV